MCNSRPQSLLGIAILFWFSSQIFSAEKVSYPKNIWPLMQRHCQDCHQPSLKKGDLDLTSYKAFSNGCMSGPIFIPLQTSNSLVSDHLTGDQQKIPMGKEPLLDEEIDLFRKWIEECNLFNFRRIYNASSNV